MKTLFTATVLLLIVFYFGSCARYTSCASGNGQKVTETLDLTAINRIDLRIPAKVLIKQGSVQQITARGDQNVIEHLKLNSSDGEWDVTFADGRYRNYDLTLELILPELKGISISGSSDVVVEDFKDQSTLDLSISGSGDITMNAFDGLEKLTSRISGSGQIKAEAPVRLRSAVISISGSGDYIAYPLIAEHCKINIVGSGTCYVQAAEALDVHISGSGDVYYKGRPKVEQSVVGSGNVQGKN